MTKLFIQEKNKSNQLVLKAVTNKDKLHPLIEKKEWKSTLISEEKTCYLYVKKESENYNFSRVYDYFVSFAKSDERNWNIDVQSFTSKDLSEDLVIQAISEGLLFGSHKTLDYKIKQ